MDVVAITQRQVSPDTGRGLPDRNTAYGRAMSKGLYWGLIVALACLLGPVDLALAWGPAVHVGLGNIALSQLGLLPASVAATLARYGLAYLYGNIAADIVFAKRWSRVKQFCHHWSTGFNMLDIAKDDRSRAFAYGYLSHLAADTVAHGKYVPHQILVSGSKVNFGHLYWELRADATEETPTWRTLEWVTRQDHAVHHSALECHITDTFLSYELNRKLFEGMNALTMRQGFRRWMDTVHRNSRWELPPGLISGYRTECMDRIHSILTQGVHSPLLHEDPNGTSALMNLHVHRRATRRSPRRNRAGHYRWAEVSAGLRPQSSLATP